MRRAIATTVFLVLGVVPGIIRAHEGHDHKVMGTVVSVAADRLEVEKKDGDTVSVALDEETRYRRGREVVGIADVKAGERVVVTIVEKAGKDTARDVMLASSGGKMIRYD
ncbi:MAG: hypothetical protein ACE5IK_14485, partial [Acidobacteriota bacterium]